MAEEKFDDKKHEDELEEETGKSADKVETEMESGKADEDVYTEEGREKLVEDGEISETEAGFMEGAEDRGEQTSCAYCGAMISEDKKNIIERNIDGEIKLFCSEDHAEKYSQKHQK
jgi:adenine-specific DNA methylase